MSLTLNAFNLKVTRFNVVNILARLTRGMKVSVPTTKRVVSCCTLKIIINTPVVTLFSDHCSLGRVLLFLITLYIVNGTVFALSSSCLVLTVNQLMSNFPRNTFFNIKTVILSGVVGPKGIATTITKVISKVAITGLLNVPLKACLDRRFD